VLGVEHRVIEPRRAILDSIDLWRVALEGQSGLGTMFIADLLDQAEPAGTPFMHGFIGDALAIGFQSIAPEVLGDHRAVAAAAVDHQRKPFAPGFEDILGLGITRESAIDDVLSDIVHEIEPYQALPVWGLEFRQSRGVASMLFPLGQKYRVATPHYRAELIDAWLTLPRAALQGKRLLRELLADRWPALGTMPHSEEEPRVVPRGRHAAAVVAQRYARRIRRGVASRLLRRRSALDPTYIWHQWHGTTDAQRRTQLRRMEEKRASVASLLGYEIPQLDGRPVWERAATSAEAGDKLLRSLYLLTEYCDWLETTLPSASTNPRTARSGA
jgi:hypothetical protein